MTSRNIALGLSCLCGAAVASFYFLPQVSWYRKSLGLWMANRGGTPMTVEPRSLPEVKLVEDTGTSRVFRVLGCNPGGFTLQGTNTYLLGTGRERILIDAGQGKTQYWRNLKKLCDAENATIKYLLITHHHFDHIGGVEHVLSLFPKCKVLKHPEIRHDETFRVESVNLRALHTPGHTQDHICFLYNESAIFSGDCVLGSGTAVFEDLAEYIASLRLLLSFPDVKTMFPGHGEVIQDPESKLRFYIEHRMKRETQIVGLLEKGGQTISELVESLYGELNLSWVVKRGAQNSVKQHLMKLGKEGKVVSSGKRYQLIQQG